MVSRKKLAHTNRLPSPHPDLQRDYLNNYWAALTRETLTEGETSNPLSLTRKKVQEQLEGTSP